MNVESQSNYGPSVFTFLSTNQRAGSAEIVSVGKLGNAPTYSSVGRGRARATARMIHIEKKTDKKMNIPT